VAADVDNDGDADLITTNLLSSEVWILAGNGDGTFEWKDAIAIDDLGKPELLRVADINRDGFLDLAVLHEKVGVSIYLGRGDGSFEAPRTFATGRFPKSMDLADVNGDGFLDLVTGREPRSTIKPEEISVQLYR
jgi:hypothetical protein